MIQTSINPVPDLVIKQILLRLPRENEAAIAMTCRRWLNQLEVIREKAENHVFIIDNSSAMRFRIDAERVNENPMKLVLSRVKILTKRIFPYAYRGIDLMIFGSQLQTHRLKQEKDLLRIEAAEPGGTQEYLPALNAALSLHQNQKRSPTKTTVYLLSNFHSHTQEILEFLSKIKSHSNPILELKFQVTAAGEGEEMKQLIKQLQQKRALEAQEESDPKRQKNEDSD